MPPEAVSLALAASIYPPAVAAIIALGRGSQVRVRVLLLVVAAFFTVLVTGALILLLLTEADVTSGQARSVGAGAYIVAGAALIALAIWLQRRPPRTKPAEAGPSKIDHYLESARLVLILGVILYVIPSPIYVALVKVIADTHGSTAQKFLYLVQALVIMLWMIELSMLLLLIFPTRGSQVLESINAWFGQHGRAAAVVVAAVGGAYLVGVGLVEIL